MGDIQIVVARYKEQMNWLANEPFCNCSVVVYNKGDDDNYLHSDNIVKHVKLPNVGFDPHSFLYHIINNYDNLADITAFFQGSIDLPSGQSVNKYGRAIDIINYCKANNCSVLSCGNWRFNNIKNDFYNFTIDQHPVSSIANRTDKNFHTVPCEIRPFGKWFETLFGDICVKHIALNHLIAIKREDIIKKPKEYYEMLFSFLSDKEEGSQPEAIHYFERAWEAVFYPLNENNFI